METEKYSEMLPTVFEGREFRDLLEREQAIGPQQILQELLEGPLLSNAQLMWVLKHMLSFYGGKDEVLLAAPPERLLTNMENLLRVTYLLIDSLDPNLDDNMRLYISTKLKQATWGLCDDIRQYLNKVNS